MSKLDSLPQVDIVYGYANMNRIAIDAFVAAGDKAIVHAGRNFLNAPIDLKGGEDLTAVEIQRPVERKGRLHGAEFNHTRHRPTGVGWTHHGWRFDGFGLLSGAGVAQSLIDGRARVGGPITVG